MRGSGHGIKLFIETQRVNIFLVKLRKTTENQDIRFRAEAAIRAARYQPLKHVIMTRRNVRDSSSQDNYYLEVKLGSCGFCGTAMKQCHENRVVTRMMEFQVS